MTSCIVLLGPPASGKSTIGAALGSLGYRWREWEPILLARWGSLETFIANKATALPEHHAEILAFVSETGPPAVLETTGISDAPFLDVLSDTHEPFFVRLDVPLDEALRRVAERPAGQHLSDELERNRATWQAFQDLVVPRRKPNLIIDTAMVDADEAAALVHEAFSLRPR
jgi:shikimate kinase